MTEPPDDPIDWSVTTWKGSRLQQHRAFYDLSFARKLELIDEMCRMADAFRPRSKSTTQAVNEDPPAENQPTGR
jgi:hypothetical protein